MTRDLGRWHQKSRHKVTLLVIRILCSQRLNSGKPLGTGCYEWLWSIATWANGICSPNIYSPK